ncbi:putative peptidase [Moraxella macacae 0408225]|uniref:Putative peptidase n=1 Tax=Moraxella macacae 0408225 TaxID=1230338 RepID=L2F9A1_9GAMM|nr:C39 family peptidase [Moraxella macacae]ELA09634.1 putative peptidase [Moraxella macacae 0408225]
MFASFFTIASYASPFSLNPKISPKNITTQSWLEQNNGQVIKQDLDYSCGASSLATVLTYFYQKPMSERQILEDMALVDVMSSFSDLANVSQKYGFIAKGFTTNYETLSKLKIPAIVYLNHNRSDHFSVIRAIDEHNVYLADSSWGNRVLSKKQFEKIWNTTDNPNYKGRVLLILPSTEQQKQLSDTDFVKIQDTQKLLRKSPKLFRDFL